MTEPIAALLQEIAVKHSIALSPDDPILVLHTLNAHLMEHNARVQQTMLDQYKAEMEEIALRWEKEAKSKAEKILTASLKAAQETTENMLQENISAITAKVRQEMEDVLAQISQPLVEAKRIALFNLIAAAMTLAAAGVAFWVVLFR